MKNDVGRTIDAVWRIESPRIVGALLRMTRDVALAEELAQEALLAALERWPEHGIPDNPSAWLVTTAKNRALDELRRRKMLARKHEEIGRELDERDAPDLETAIDEDVGDDVLRLVLIACHPVLSTEARVALTLRLVAGLTTEEIARAFLVAEPTVAQRITRAKRTLAEARVPFEVPRGAELAERLESVLEVVYLVFNEGYLATSGDDLMRPQLCEDALRLGRILAALVPNEPEVHGLVALMELSASRADARVDAKGDPVLLLEQDRARWSPLLIRRGLEALARAESLQRPLGPYTIQAAIAACHARARTARETDWARIVALYDALAQITGSPVVELNRAVAVGMAFGPEQALELVDALQEESVLRDYHLLYAVRADLLIKLGRAREARAELERAAFLAKNARDKAMLLDRASKLGD
ncbi:RNA polymerase sigma factor [Sandaracinus amylolyticus]|uniref:RNA polymerase sigma-70 factor, ECF subfamily n=1 Tax=Sandaracinus amylolyticus TaxID=927083 RepID=A0A0F6SHQ2_9BACT|nr:RNA polymerase sigma factor [Sandaracinus amylolyticus]AKF10839.1 RNA polymerase sigma-70 factor, ECF subfamily [Sandaracinus amylolyticus]